LDDLGMTEIGPPGFIYWIGERRVLREYLNDFILVEANFIDGSGWHHPGCYWMILT